MPGRVQQRPQYRHQADSRYRHTTAYVTDGNTARAVRPQQESWGYGSGSAQNRTFGRTQASVGMGPQMNAGMRSQLSGSMRSQAGGSMRSQMNPGMRPQTNGSLALAAPQVAPRPRTAPRPQISPRHREAEQTASISITLPLTIILVAAVIAALYLGYNYLCLKSSLDAHMNTIKTLETSLDNIRTENDALERSIDTSVDLNYVYQVAVSEFGMVRAGQNNIIQYDKTESEYVRQYEDLPATN